MRRSVSHWSRVIPLAGASLVLCLAGLIGPGAQQPAQKYLGRNPDMLVEIRAIHVAAADWVSPDPDQCRANIQTVFQNLQRGGFNVAFFQVREGAEVLFPSRLEPWSHRIGGKDPGFDPLKLAIERGHEKGIKVYAWAEAMTLGMCEGPRAPTDPPSLYETRGPAAEDSWVCRTEDGKIMECEDMYYLSPGIPAVQGHVRAVVREIAEGYPELDGLFLNEVRYPSAGTSHDPVSVRRYHEEGNPGLDYWTDWQRDQLTQFMIDLFAQIRQLRPTLAIGVGVSGIYSRSRFDGNPALPSGYHDHYEDTLAWVRSDAVDFVVPRITDALREGGPDYHALAEDAFDLYEEPRLVAGVDMGAFRVGTETEEWVRYPQNTGALGVAALSYASVAKADVWDTLRDAVFDNSVMSMPIADEKRAMRGGLVVLVLDPAGKSVTDAAARLRGVRQVRTSSSDGLAAFLNVESGERKLTVTYPGVVPVEQDVVIRPAEIGDVAVHLPGVDSVSPVYLAILNPDDGDETPAEAVNVLGRTNQAKSATVNGERVPILSTNLFVLDQIPLNPGRNTIEVAVEGANGETVRRTVEVTRVPEPTPTPLPPSFPLFIDEKSLVPNDEVRLSPGEMLYVGFTGAPDNIAEYRLPWTDWIQLAEETIPGTGKGTGRYGLRRAFVRQEDTTPGNLQIRLRVRDESRVPADTQGPRSIEFVPPFGISLYGNESYRLLRVREETGHLVHGLHSVRLGGPYLAELPEGTLLRVTGRRGNYYHVQLSADLDAWVPIDEVENASAVEPPPHMSFTSISIQGDELYDTITFPFSERVPFRITPVTREDQPAALEIDFFYAHDAATWISHRPTAKVVRIVTTEQIATDHLRVRAELRTKQIWGYKYEVGGTSLKITIRRPPVLGERPESPLKGLTVAVEAGHGGTSTGAGGVSGTPEKVINRWTTDQLLAALQAKGASVVNCRIDDETVSLGTRVRRAEEANADLFISIHANSASQARGYLRVSGTSTYYKWPFSSSFADAIHEELLANTGLGDFGNVGNFNYTPIRTTWMPAMLVEQAFMSNPEDEAKMLDPAFRQTMVEAIVAGTESFLRKAR